ncbi:hypothetical protein H5410_045915 [Solanum commersonii]|uniref:Uncharacterized protein n=1 Tax=Solanum commersonii TaxID=4109 RepID=A0A9J5XAU7_SOLCO|nr:hypothetical protein H5410_045915 [Solanum commersonii]
MSMRDFIFDNRILPPANKVGWARIGSAIKSITKKKVHSLTLWHLVRVKGQSRSVIIIPENTFNEGWGDLVTKVENFIEIKVEKKVEFITKRELNLNTIVGKGDYKGALHNSK